MTVELTQCGGPFACDFIQSFIRFRRVSLIANKDCLGIVQKQFASLESEMGFFRV